MENGNECCSTQLIEGDGTFNDAGFKNFQKEVRLAEYGLSYAVVSIMGSQSSGKSTLLNRLFGTNFREMDTSKRRCQTTKGIWLARCAGIEPCTLVMDLEGTDGREREEDETAFEEKIALFALAVSDILIINMWCHDIGRQVAASRPLFKTLFQFMMQDFSKNEVMMQVFCPRKITLLFVLRDKTRAPLDVLVSDIMEDVHKMWDDSIPKSQAHQETLFSEFFNVKVVALSNYEDKEEQFKEQVASLRQQFFSSIAPGGLAGDRRGVVSGFSFSAQQIWKIIMENKDLDLTAHKVMVANLRCDQIANKKLASFLANEEWRRIDRAVPTHVSGFGKKLSSIIDTCLSEYDAEATYFNEGVRSAKREHLKERLLQHVQPAYQSLLGYLRSKSLSQFREAVVSAVNGGEEFSAAAAADARIESFMTQFDEGCADAFIEQANWDSNDERKKLQNDINAFVAAVCAARLATPTEQAPGQWINWVRDGISAVNVVVKGVALMTTGTEIFSDCNHSASACQNWR